MSLQEKMTALADAIRKKTGGTDPLTLDEMAAAVSGISGEASGSLPEVSSITISGITPEHGISFGSGSDGVSHFIRLASAVGDAAERGMIDTDTQITLQSPIAYFGDAAAEDVAAGKTFTSSAGLMVTGTHECAGGLVRRSGSTTSAVIETGLSSISCLILYKSSIAATGLVQAVYDGSASSYIYCSSYGEYINSCVAGTGAYGSAGGGTFTWGGTGNAALTDGVTYNWIACGQA